MSRASAWYKRHQTRGDNAGHEVVQDLANAPDHQRKVAVVPTQLRSGTCDVVNEPFSVREGHYQVVTALPNRHRYSDGLELDVPRRHECEVVVVPSPGASRFSQSCGSAPWLASR
jgi:hypothetical protein